MLKLQRVLVAGATGYLGRYIVKALKQAGYYVKILVRSKDKLRKEGPFFSPAIYQFVDEIIVGDVSDSKSLQGVCSNVDFVFSSVGTTRQKGKLTFMDVDYRGNLHLLKEAEKSKVQRFMYIHVHAAENCPSALIKAKQQFVNELKNSSVPYIIVNPTGYFSDLTEFLKMDKKGRVFLFGNGLNKMNPIHGADLADFCISSFSKKDISLHIGGPKVYTYREIASIALNIAENNGKITTIPNWLIRSMLPFLWLLNKKQFGLFQFFFYVMTHDIVADSYGKTDLQVYFENINN